MKSYIDTTKYRIHVETCDYMPDGRWIRRSFWQRWFTRPWNPRRLIDGIAPLVYMTENQDGSYTLVVSPQTAKDLDLKQLLRNAQRLP